MYSGTPKMWTFWGPRKSVLIRDMILISGVTAFVQWNPQNVDIMGPRKSVLIREMVLISGVTAFDLEIVSVSRLEI